MARVAPQPGRPLRGQKKKRIFKADYKTSSFCVRWEVLKGSGKGQPAILEELRQCARTVGEAVHSSKVSSATSSSSKISGNAEEKGRGLRASPTAPVGITIGLKATCRAVLAGDALAVVACTDGIASVLVQHLPVMCALRDIPIAILAASPEALLNALTPMLDASFQTRLSHVVAIALCRSCLAQPRLAQLYALIQRVAPSVNVPFLVPSSGVPTLRRKTTCSPAPVSTQQLMTQKDDERHIASADLVEEGVIQLPPSPDSEDELKRRGNRNAARVGEVRTAWTASVGLPNKRRVRAKRESSCPAGREVLFFSGNDGSAIDDRMPMNVGIDPTAKGRCFCAKV